MLREPAKLEPQRTPKLAAILLTLAAKTASAQAPEPGLPEQGAPDQPPAEQEWAPEERALPQERTPEPVEDPSLLGALGVSRRTLDETGLDLDLSLISDYSRVLSGGVRRDSALRGLFGASLLADLDRLFGLEGGLVFARFLAFEGDFGSADTGDLQIYSNIDSIVEFALLSELYYQQLIGPSLRLKLGKVDANSEFAYVEYGSEFINSSMGFSPTIFTLPTYPEGSPSANLFLRAGVRTTLGVGVYDGATIFGLPLGDPSDHFWIAQGDQRWSLGQAGLAGRIGLGGWYHTGSFNRFDGGVDDGTGGLYLVLEQELARSPYPERPRGHGAYLQLGWADEEVSPFALHLGLGWAHPGGFGHRAQDSYGVGMTRVELSDAPQAGFTAGAETSFELFYRWQATGWLALKPDLQYILDPAGNAERDHALVATARLELVL